MNKETHILVAVEHPKLGESHASLTLTKDNAGVIREAIATGEFQAVLDEIWTLKDAGLSYSDIRRKMGLQPKENGH